MTRPTLKFEDKIIEAGFSLQYFWSSIDLIIEEGIYTESKDPQDVASWFFFSQVLFLITAKHPVFKDSLMKIEKDGLDKRVTSLSYFLILFAQNNIEVNPIVLFLSGESSGENIVEKLLLEHYGDHTYQNSFSEAQVFLTELVQHKKKGEIDNMFFIKVPVFLAFLRKLNFSPTDYLSACRVNTELFDSVPVRHRGQKMFFYWRMLFYGLAFPKGLILDKNPLASPFLTQGNLTNLEFLILHYMLLWKNLSKKDQRLAGEHFSREALSLSIMMKQDSFSIEDAPGQELQALLGLIRTKVGDFEYVAALRTVTEALNFMSETAEH